MRKFKINGVRFEIGNICDTKYKYEVYMLEENFWLGIGKCNTLAEGKEVAYDYLKRIKEEKEYNEQQEINYNKYLEDLKNKKIYCVSCKNELSLDMKLNGFDECEECIKKYY